MYPFITSIIAHTHSRFQRRAKPAKAPLDLPSPPAQPCTSEQLEAAVERFQQTCARMLAKLDRIEAKVDLLDIAIKLPE